MKQYKKPKIEVLELAVDVVMASSMIGDFDPNWLTTGSSFDEGGNMQ